MFAPRPPPPSRTRTRAAKNAKTTERASGDDCYDRGTATALDPIAPRWLVSAWDVLSVAPASSRGRGDWRVACSTLLATSCVYVLYMTPDMLCLLRRDCRASPFTVIEGMFPRTMAVACLASRLIALATGGRTAAAVAEHARAVAAFRALRPVTRAERDALELFARRVALAGVLLVVPLNALRTWTIASAGVPGRVVAAFALMYAQNLGTWCAETHFAALCHALSRMFAAVNRDLAAIKAREVARNRYPTALAARHRWFPADADDDGSCPLRTAARVRRLRAMHGLAVDAAVGLNRAFGVHAGLSLCALCLYFLLDAYFHAEGSWKDRATWDLMFYGWIAQYVFRFLVVVLLAHTAAKQASESKILLTDINNRFLDKSTKEELQLFLNQIYSRTVKFTACDFFTINIHLIISAIAVGTTYLVILLQLNASN